MYQDLDSGNHPILFETQRELGYHLTGCYCESVSIDLYSQLDLVTKGK